MKILKITNGSDILEVQYNEQSDGVYISEAQFFARGTRGNGGVHFDMDEPEDVKALIDTLTEIYNKQLAHYSKQPK